MFILSNASTGHIIANKITQPRGWYKRTLGLMGCKSLDEGEGIWLDDCWGIHTIGMKFSIDILFLNGELRITGMERNVKPGRLAVSQSQARHIIELAIGTLDKNELLKGDRVRIATA